MHRKANVAAFDKLAPGDGTRFAADINRVGADAPFLFALFGGSLWSTATLKIVAREAWRRGFRGLAAFFGEALGTARGWLETRYRSELTRAVRAVVLHTGLGPESAYSGQMAKVIAFALEAAGAPIVKGGAAQALAAFDRLIRDQGGEILLGADAERSFSTTRAPPAASGSPTAATSRRPRGSSVRSRPTSSTGGSSPTRSFPPRSPMPWRSTATAKATCSSITRCGRRRDGRHRRSTRSHSLISRRVSTAFQGGERGGARHAAGGADHLPRPARCARSEPLSRRPVDPVAAAPGSAAFHQGRCGRRDRAAGGWTLDRGGAGEIRRPRRGDPRFAHRQFPQRRHRPQTASAADLETLNVNLVGGDPYGGFCGVDQFFLWRPFRNSVNHRTPVARLHHIGASTHPGPGLGGGSGFLVAQALA